MNSDYLVLAMVLIGVVVIAGIVMTALQGGIS